MKMDAFIRGMVLGLAAGAAVDMLCCRGAHGKNLYEQPHVYHTAVSADGKIRPYVLYTDRQQLRRAGAGGICGNAGAVYLLPRTL